MKTTTKTFQEANIEFYLGSKTNADLNEYKDIKIMTYLTEIRGIEKPALLVWKGKQKNPFHNYFYNNTEQANEAIKRLISSADNREQRKEEIKAERKAFIPNFEVGDIFCSSWGYEQTNVDFYQVVEKVGKSTAIIREIAHEMVKDSSESNGMSCNVTAVKDSFLNEDTQKKRVGKYGITLSSYASASKWDGTPKYKSWYY